MGRVVIVAYRPREGREDDLLSAIRDHVPALRGEGLATHRKPLILRAEDGTYLEIFEWASAEAIEAAHQNAVVQAMWARFAEACEYRTLASLPEASEPFAEFEPVDDAVDRLYRLRADTPPPAPRTPPPDPPPSPRPSRARRP